MFRHDVSRRLDTAFGTVRTGETRGRLSGTERIIGERLRMRQRMFELGDAYWVETDSGQRAFQIDGKALRECAALLFNDLAGNEVYRIQEKLLRVRDSMYVYRGVDVAAKVHNGLYRTLRDRFLIEVPGGPDLMTRGSILYREYGLERDGYTVARISRRWFQGQDTYGVDIAPDEDRLLILAITVIVDSMSHAMH